MIKQISVMDTEFKKYGKVIEGYDLKEILQKMEETPCPDDVVYVASVKGTGRFKGRQGTGRRCYMARCRSRSVTANLDITVN